MTVYFRADAENNVLGSDNHAPFNGHQVQPDIQWYRDNNVPPFGGSWVKRHFCEVITPRWGGKAYQLTIYPAKSPSGVDPNSRERSELQNISHRNKLGSVSMTNYPFFHDHPNHPVFGVGQPTMYFGMRHQYGDSTFPWTAAIQGQVNWQIKSAGYDDPDNDVPIPSTAETLNFQSGPFAEIHAKSPNSSTEVGMSCRGGVLKIVNYPTVPVIVEDYVPGTKSKFTKEENEGGIIVSGRYVDWVIELTVSSPWRATKMGRMRVWGRKEGDIRPWLVNGLPNPDLLIRDTFESARPSTPDQKTGFSAQNFMNLGDVEDWQPNYDTVMAPTQNDYTHTYPYLGPQNSDTTGIYRGGAHNGETATHRIIVDNYIVASTFAEAAGVVAGGGSDFVGPARGLRTNTSQWGSLGTIGQQLNTSPYGSTGFTIGSAPNNLDITS